jgi:hypothetical protein
MLRRVNWCRAGTVRFALRVAAADVTGAVNQPNRNAPGTLKFAGGAGPHGPSTTLREVLLPERPPCYGQAMC